MEITTINRSARSHHVWPYLQLLRPANLVTAAADILAGFAAAGRANGAALLWLLAAGVCLYGGGVVLNDFFDRELDAAERPERPIPSGRVPALGAALLGFALLAAGFGAAAHASAASGALALAIALAAVLYDAWGKHQRVLGPLNMGACRGLNLLLGASAVPAMLGERWYLALLPVAYIAAITAVSAGEVHGGKRGAGLLALGLIGGVLLAMLALAATPGFHLLPLLPFLALLAMRVLPPFWRAARAPEPALIRAAVKAGVLSLILLDAAIAAGYAGLLYGLLVAVLLFVAAGIARLFAVT